MTWTLGVVSFEQSQIFRKEKGSGFQMGMRINGTQGVTIVSGIDSGRISALYTWKGRVLQSDGHQVGVDVGVNVARHLVAQVLHPVQALTQIVTVRKMILTQKSSICYGFGFTLFLNFFLTVSLIVIFL